MGDEGRGAFHEQMLSKALPETLRRVTVPAATLGHVRESQQGPGRRQGYHLVPWPWWQVKGWSFYRQNQKGEQCTGLSGGKSSPQWVSGQRGCVEDTLWSMSATVTADQQLDTK